MSLPSNTSFNQLRLADNGRQHAVPCGVDAGRPALCGKRPKGGQRWREIDGKPPWCDECSRQVCEAMEQAFRQLEAERN